jgi:protein TonB
MTKDKRRNASEGPAQIAGSAQNGSPASRPLFGTLLASAPLSEKGRTIGFIGSAVFHMGLVGALAYATMAVGQEVAEDEEMALIELAQDAPPPPPPPPPPQVQMERMEAPIAQGFQELVMPTIVPPVIPPPEFGVKFDPRNYSGEGTRGGVHDGDSTSTRTTDDVTIQPQFTPMTVAPALTNVAEVQRALVRSYPAILRDAGIGGKPVVWFLIDETGKVIKTQLSKSSGHASLDEAAMKVAEVMKFTPAMNIDRKVTVWVELPIEFQVK